MSSIIPHVFPDTGQPVRSITINGEAWFVGRDVAAVLGYSNPTRDVARHTTERQRRQYRIGTPSGEQSTTVLSEPGVYRLVMRSNLPSAERFQDWLAEEVIPSIRRTGAYHAAPPAPALPDLTSPQGVLALAQQFVQVAEQLVSADARIAEMEPKALAHDTYLSAQSGERLVREVAKLLGWRQQDLRRFLIDEKLIFAREALCGVTVWDFYAANARHFRSVEHPVEHRWGRCSHYTLYVRPAGVDLIQKRIAKRQAEMAAVIANSP